MIIKSFELFKFQIPLKYPLKISKTSIKNRKGFVLKLIDEKRNVGFGEISPLPGFHQESLSEIKDQLTKILPKILYKEISNNVNINLDVPFKGFELFPSVQFGVESALFSLIADHKNISIFDFFNASPKKSIEINALLSGTTDQILEKTKQYLKNGFTVFKLKVGRNKVNEEIELVNRVNSLINGKAKIRLDANQTWNLQETLHFFQNITTTNLEYIEEPLQEFQELPQLLNKSQIPIAFDENLLKIYEVPERFLSHIKAIIIKPTIIGEMRKCYQLIRFAEQNGISAVISDTFQTGLGLSMLIAIARTINKHIAMGFDTYSWLENDILVNKIQFNKNKIELMNFPDINNNLNYSYLTKIL